MAGQILFMREYAEFYATLDAFQRDLVNRVVARLYENPYNLPYPYSSGTSQPRIRELRVQNVQHPIRVFYALDPHRDAVLLYGGNKKGEGNQSKWLQRMAVRAETIFTDYLFDLARGVRRALAYDRLPQGETAREAAPVRKRNVVVTPRDASYGPPPPMKQWPSATITAITTATGWMRHEVIAMMQPGMALDPASPDAQKRIGELLRHGLHGLEASWHGNVRGGRRTTSSRRRRRSYHT